MARVTATSSGLGVGSPLGWLWMTITAEAFFRTASLKSSPTLTCDELTEPQHHPQMFLLQRGHLVGDQRGGVSGGVDGGTFLRGFESQTASKFDGGFDLGGFGVAKSMLFLQFSEGRAVQTGQPAKIVEQSLTDSHRVFTSHADPQEDGDQFSVGQSLGSQ
jgi:hypothetical protein